MDTILKENGVMAYKVQWGRADCPVDFSGFAPSDESDSIFWCTWAQQFSSPKSGPKGKAKTKREVWAPLYRMGEIVKESL